MTICICYLPIVIVEETRCIQIVIFQVMLLEPLSLFENTVVILLAHLLNQLISHEILEKKIFLMLHIC